MGLNITQFHGDNEFKKTRSHVIPSILNTCAVYANISVFEHVYLTVKDRFWCSCHSVTYTCFTKIMTKAVIKYTIYWLSTSYSDNGVSDILSTYAISQALHNPNYDKVTIDFRSYNQLNTSTNNTTKSIRTGSIYL